MPLPDSARPLDAVAVQRAVRRLAAAPSPPWLHAEVARRMAERLAVIRRTPEIVVDWCAWLGAGGAVLAAAYPDATRIAVEPSPELAERSRAAAKRAWWSIGRARRAPRVLADGDALPAPAGLVWSNMALHGVKDPPALFARWESLLTADGFVMFSCLGPGTLAALRALYAEAGWGAPTQAFVDMHDLGDMLVGAGFADPVMDQETLTLHWPDPDALLADLRALGGNAAPGRFPGLRTPRWRGQLAARIAGMRRTDGRPRLAFEVAYGHAFKAPPRPAAGAPTTVSLDEMRALVRATR